MKKINKKIIIGLTIFVLGMTNVSAKRRKVQVLTCEYTPQNYQYNNEEINAKSPLSFEFQLSTSENNDGLEWEISKIENGEKITKRVYSNSFDNLLGNKDANYLDNVAYKVLNSYSCPKYFAYRETLTSYESAMDDSINDLIKFKDVMKKKLTVEDDYFVLTLNKELRNVEQICFYHLIDNNESNSKNRWSSVVLDTANKMYYTTVNGAVVENKDYSNNTCPSAFSIEYGDENKNSKAHPLTDEELKQNPQNILYLYTQNSEGKLQDNSPEKKLLDEEIEKAINNSFDSKNISYGPLNCEDIFDTDTAKFIGNIYFYIELTAIIIVIFLTVKDYAVAILNSNADEMKKCNKRLITRLLIIAVLLILPLLIKFIYKAFNLSGAEDPMCGMIR